MIDDHRSLNWLSIGQIVDAVIMPVASHAAVIPGKYYHTAYTEAINLMSYSAAVVPVALANKDLDPYDNTYMPRSEIDQLNWEACKSSFLPSLVQILGLGVGSIVSLKDG